MSPACARAMQLESEKGAHNYHPIPAVLSRGEGVHVWDVDGNQYLDFLSADGAVNQVESHSHATHRNQMNIIKKGA